METIRNATKLGMAIFLVFLGGCAPQGESKEVVGEYLCYAGGSVGKNSFDIVLMVEHVKGDRFSFKRWYGDKLAYDDVFVVEDRIIYEMGQKAGEANMDFSNIELNGYSFKRID